MSNISKMDGNGKNEKHVVFQTLLPSIQYTSVQYYLLKSLALTCIVSKTIFKN